MPAVFDRSFDLPESLLMDLSHRRSDGSELSRETSGSSWTGRTWDTLQRGKEGGVTVVDQAGAAGLTVGPGSPIIPGNPFSPLGPGWPCTQEM